LLITTQLGIPVLKGLLVLKVKQDLKDILEFKVQPVSKVQLVSAKLDHKVRLD